MLEDHSSIRSATPEYRQVFSPSSELQMSYLLSSQGRIMDIGGDWDKFAWANDGFDAMADVVVGRHLSEFLDGFETTSFFNAIMFACRRAHKAFEMITRCDSPQRINLFRMRISPAEEDLLEVSNTLLMSRSIPPWKRADGIRTRIDTARCSMCGSFRHARRWVDPLSEPRLDFRASHYLICPDCKSRARAALQRSGTANGRTSAVLF